MVGDKNVLMTKKTKSNILQFPPYHRDDVLFKKMVRIASNMETSREKFVKLEDDLINQMLQNIKYDGSAKKKDFADLSKIMQKFHKDRINKIKNKLKLK